MAARKVYNEGASVVATVTHTDTDDEAFVPVTLRYRVDSLTRGEVVLEWTSVATPAASNVIAIPAALQVLDHDRLQDLRQIVVEATDTSGYTYVTTVEYAVRNLQGVE